MIATSHSKIGIVELLTYFSYWGAREKLRALQGMAVQREAPMVIGPNLELKGRKAGLEKSLVSEVSAKVSSQAQILVLSASASWTSSLRFQTLGLNTGEFLGPAGNTHSGGNPDLEPFEKDWGMGNKADRETGS